MTTRETPPRTWGRQPKHRAAENHLRNTPTHVGKTGTIPLPFRNRRKHPHARGEDKRRASSSMPPEETPPRTWGRLNGKPRDLSKLRNTPTHVGKTRRLFAAWYLPEKHPHARGEDVLPPAISPQATETPPRTWGRRPEVNASLEGVGNTPTHVGKTSPVPCSSAARRKHPHARGEDTWNLLAFFLLTFNKELGRHLNQKLKIFPFGRNTGLQAKKSNSSVDESLSPQCTWL